MKAVLVIDEMPNSCDECPCCCDCHCSHLGRELGIWALHTGKPVDCPLKLLPQKKEVEVNKIDDYMHTEFSVDKLSAKILLDTEKLIALGWNACLEEIEK